MNQAITPEITIATDFGSSLAKGIYTLDNQTFPPLNLILLEPEVIKLSFESIESYEKNKLGTGKEEDSAWLRLRENYYAVGFLAKNRFGTLKALHILKIDSAIPLMLAMLGVIAQKHRLAPKFKVNMSILLPWSEYKDKERFEEEIEEAMKSFSFRGEEYTLELKTFAALPEGGGLLARGRVPRKAEKEIRPQKSSNILILIMGYRNSSLLAVQKGELIKGLTSDFGFSKMVNRILELTSGQREERLIPVICEIASKKNPEKIILEKLVRTTIKELELAEVETLKSAIENARNEYVLMLRNWLQQQIPVNNIDEILIGGGTAKYLKKEITESLKVYRGAELNWLEDIEKRIIATFGERVKKDDLAVRLTDVFTLYYKFTSLPLPLLKEKASQVKEVGGVKNV